MSLQVKSGGDGFEITPEGTYIGRCYKLIDLGTQTSTGMFGTKSQHKVMISWELLGDDAPRMADGRPYSVTQWYTASLNEKASLRKDLEAWRGKKFTDEELEGFDLKNVIGAYCMIQIVHSTDGKYANVNAIMAYKGTKPAPVNPNVIFDIDNPDMAVFEGFSDNMKQKIIAAPEWQPNSRQTASSDFTDPFEVDSLPNELSVEPEPPDFLQPDNPDITDEEMNQPVQLPDLDMPKKAAKK